MQNKGFKKAVMVIAKQRFRDEELFDTQKHLEAADVRTVVASSQMGERPGKMGGSAKATMLVSDIIVEELDALIFIGGDGAAEYYDNIKAHELAKDTIKKGKVLAAICIAPRILANARLLKGKKYTCWESELENIQKLGGEPAEGDVVRDGKIITANGPHAADEFGKTIAEALREI